MNARHPRHQGGGGSRPTSATGRKMLGHDRGGEQDRVAPEGLTGGLGNTPRLLWSGAAIGAAMRVRRLQSG